MKKKTNIEFYKIGLPAENENSLFIIEYEIILRTVESVNNFNLLYKAGRLGSKGPSTHEQQDLYRAMLIFACAGLDVLLKQLIKTKISDIISADKKGANEKFKEYVKSSINLKDPNKLLNTIALALVDQNPKEILMSEYIKYLTRDSLQAKEKIITIILASGFSDKFLSKERLNSLKDVFEVRNQIIHEMDINILDNLSKNKGYRKRRQRKAAQIEKYTKIILDLSVSIFTEYKRKFDEFKIETKKSSVG
ncbi:MAG: hypothetical protein M0Q93_02165 [Terrimicrobiaceae bacterium]|nr:hypothetical protein [Terrimicrobiaceae bacterium]